MAWGSVPLFVAELSGLGRAELEADHALALPAGGAGPAGGDQRARPEHRHLRRAL